MAELPGWLMRHLVGVETHTGDSGEGPVYAARVDGIRCNQQGSMSTNADAEHVGAVKLYLRLDQAPRFTLGSLVHLDGGGTVTVQAVADHRDGGLGAWQHLEVVCT